MVNQEAEAYGRASRLSGRLQRCLSLRHISWRQARSFLLAHHRMCLTEHWMRLQLDDRRRVVVAEPTATGEIAPENNVQYTQIVDPSHQERLLTPSMSQ